MAPALYVQTPLLGLVPRRVCAAGHLQGEVEPALGPAGVLALPAQGGDAAGAEGLKAEGDKGTREGVALEAAQL